MIFFSAGLPGRFSEWCDAVVVQAAERALGAVETAAAESLEGFALAVIGSRAPGMVVCTRYLGRLQNALRKADRRFVVALDDPHRAVHHLVRQYGVEFLEATRAVACSCASACGCLTIPGALVLHAEAAAADPLATAAAIVHHLQLDLDSEVVADIVGDLAGLGISPQSSHIAVPADTPPESQRAVLAGALDPYIAHFAGAELQPITWERELFLIGEGTDARVVASRPVDITGTPRYLVYGPYITLPPGSWSATVALGFSKEAAEMSYIVDIFAGTQLTHVRIEPGSERLLEIDLHFSIVEPLDEPIVLRILNERAAFDGKLALGHVSLTPHAYLRPETRSYLAGVLGQ